VPASQPASQPTANRLQKHSQWTIKKESEEDDVFTYLYESEECA
jgi:hypothetical protein